MPRLRPLRLVSQVVAPAKPVSDLGKVKQPAASPPQHIAGGHVEHLGLLVEIVAGDVEECREAVRAQHRRHLPVGAEPAVVDGHDGGTRSEEHTSELQSLMRISYAVFCLKKKTKIPPNTNRKSILRTHRKRRPTYNNTTCTIE